MRSLDNPLKLVVDIILAIIIILLFPLFYIEQKQDVIIQTIVEMETEKLVQEVRRKGYINRNMYEDYLEILSVTGMLYDIELEHKHTSFEPEYRFRTEQEVIEEQNNTYKGTNEYHYRPISTDIPHIEDPIENSGELNTETNESILEGAIKTPADANHVHTDICYDGEKHFHNSSCDRTYHPVKKRTVKERNSSENHSGCGGTLHFYSYVNECTKCGAYFQYSQTTCSGNCDTFAYSSSGGCSCSGYYTYSCGKTEGRYYNGDTEVSPHCHLKVINITPTHPIQKVYINESFITTATVTYQDGSTDIILCNTNDTSDSVVSDKTVKLRYTDGTGATMSTSIVVTVIPRNKTCPNGHVYNMNSDNTDPGCPFCRGYLESLIISHPLSKRLTIYKGTTLQENDVILLATYMDGRKEYISTGYLDNLDKDYVGTQTVTLSYKGLYTTLQVITKRNIRLCSVCNRYYELYPDDTDPGCPYCEARTPIFTGRILEYDDKYYRADIFEKIYEGNGNYYFSHRDYLTMTVTNRKKEWGERYLGSIFGGIRDRCIHVVNGGYIREEIHKLR